MGAGVQIRVSSAEPEPDIHRRCKEITDKNLRFKRKDWQLCKLEDVYKRPKDWIQSFRKSTRWNLRCTTTW